MIKFLLLPILLFLSFLSTNPTKEYTIAFSEKLTPKASFSCEILAKKSFHIVIAKNTQNSYTLVPMRVKEEKMIAYKFIGAFKKMPSILSYHNNGDILTLVLSIDSKKITNYFIADINVNSGESILSEPIVEKDFKTVVRKQNESLLLFSNGSSLKIKEIRNANIVDDIEVIPAPNALTFFNDFKEFGISTVNTNEFVRNGSVRRVKVYNQHDELILTNDNLKLGHSKVLKIPLDKGDLNSVSYNIFNYNLDKKKENASYVYDNKLFQLAFDKHSTSLLVHDIENRNVKEYDLKSVLINNASKGFVSIDDFIKQAKRSVNKPTITVNKADNNIIKIRIDYVFFQTYNYYNNWWFHDAFWQQQMLRQQQQMIQSIQNSVPKFGPLLIDNVAYFSVSKDTYFEFVLDLNTYEIVKEEVKIFYDDIDKKKMLDKFVKFRKIKNFKSHVFIDRVMYNFAFDKKGKSFELFETPLK